MGFHEQKQQTKKLSGTKEHVVNRIKPSMVVLSTEVKPVEDSVQRPKCRQRIIFRIILRKKPGRHHQETTRRHEMV